MPDQNNIIGALVSAPVGYRGVIMDPPTIDLRPGVNQLHHVSWVRLLVRVDMVYRYNPPGTMRGWYSMLNERPRTLEVRRRDVQGGGLAQSLVDNAEQWPLGTFIEVHGTVHHDVLTLVDGTLRVKTYVDLASLDRLPVLDGSGA